METKEYFEKVMQDYDQHRNGRSLRKYCKDELIDYDWLLAFKKDYPSGRAQSCPSFPADFISCLFLKNA